MNQYEAMFLFDPTFAGSFENCEAEVRRLIGRADGEVIFCRKWDERRLAYKMKGRKRGVYVLVYFNGPPDKIGVLERDVQISENVLRILVLRAEGVTREMMEAAASASGREQSSAGADDARPTSSKTDPVVAEKPSTVKAEEPPAVKAEETPAAPEERVEASSATETAVLEKPKEGTAAEAEADPIGTESERSPLGDTEE